MTKIDTPYLVCSNSNKNLAIETTSYKASVTADDSDKGDFHVSGQVIVDLKGKDKILKVRTLLDTGCGTNFIFADLLNELEYEYICTHNMEITGINTSETKTTELVRIFLESPECPVKSIKCYTIPNLLQIDLEKSALNKIYKDCEELPNFFNPLTAQACHGKGVGLLLGPGTIKDISSAPPFYFKDYLVDNTYFGAAVSGRLPSSNILNSYLSSLHRFHNLPELQESSFYNEQEIKERLDVLSELNFLSEKESLGIKNEEIHANDQICLNKFKESVSYDVVNKRYTVALPFNQNKYYLVTNERVAFRRMQALQRQFLSNKEYGIMYAQQVQLLLKADYIEEVDARTVDGDIIHYLPHRGILKSESKTTSLRIVMDASCKPDASSFSLNDCLFTGPNLIFSIMELVMKFRENKYGITADIEKAFLNLLIRKQDRDAMRFFFPENVFDPGSKMKIYRYKVVMFGASCSPFLLAAVIQIHLEKHVQDRVLQDSLKSIFIDNLITTKPTEIEAVQLYHNARKIFADMGLNIRQWASNSEKVVALAKQDQVWDNSDSVKLLGHFWDPISDEISLKPNLKLFPNQYTKLAVLKCGNQVIDSLGLILPLEMRYRIFLTSLWEDKSLGWKTSFASNPTLVKEWDDIVQNIQIGLSAKIPRTIDMSAKIELHVFSDASFNAFGTVAYFTIGKCDSYPEGISQIRLAKGKVVSKKKCPKIDTIPKLELCGIVMSANAAANIIKAHPNIEFSRKVLWSDSQTAIKQCAAISNKTPFVHNRVKQIRELCHGFELRYVQSEHNPADYITKQVKVEKFMNGSLWWQGPSWLTDSDTWDPNNLFQLVPDVSLSKKTEWSTSVKMAKIKVHTMVGEVEATVPELTEQTIKGLFWKYSNYRQLIRVFSGLNFLVKFAKNKSWPGSRPVNRNDFAEGERLAIKTMQAEAFPHVIQDLKAGRKPVGDKGQFRQLKLYLDSQGIIRLHGRLNDEAFQEANRPILFAYNHPLTISYILHKHRCMNCSSVTYTLNALRRDIHTPKFRKQIVELVKKCITCRRLLSRPYRYPEHSPLNDYRLMCDQPFSMVGVDYIGPFTIRTSAENVKREKDKIWIILFSCLVSRAIYLVQVTDRKTETFLHALRELSSRRNTEPKMFISDNEGAFKAAIKVLKSIAERPEIKAVLDDKNIIWKFLPSRASWMGGVYERLVQIIKIELYKLQRNAKFSYEEWHAHLIEIEALVNDRPLSYVPDKDEEPDVVTPNAIMHGCKSSKALATDLNIDEAIASMKEYQSMPETLYQERIKLKKKFWENLTDNYIMALRNSKYKATNSKGRYCNKTPELGCVVSIYDTNTKLGGRLGVITKLIPSEDGVVRNAEVRTTVPSKVPLDKSLRTEYKIKAIKHLLPLELNVNFEDFQNPDEILLDDADIDQSVNINQEPSTTVVEVHNEPSTTVVEVHQEPPSSNIDQLPTTSVEDQNLLPPTQSPNIQTSINTEDNSTKKPIDKREPPCANKNCVRPIRNPEYGVRMVGCDREGCSNWHHYECVGLEYGVDHTPNVFACPECWSPNKGSELELSFRETNRNGRSIRRAAAKSRKMIIDLAKRAQV